jgi:hypothetical protein
MDRDDPAYKGQAGYNPFVRAIYDPGVLGFMARVVWRCPTPPVVERYRRHLGPQTSRCRPRHRVLHREAARPPGIGVR